MSYWILSAAWEVLRNSCATPEISYLPKYVPAACENVNRVAFKIYVGIGRISVENRIVITIIDRGVKKLFKMNMSDGVICKQYITWGQNANAYFTLPQNGINLLGTSVLARYNMSITCGHLKITENQGVGIGDREGIGG